MRLNDPIKIKIKPRYLGIFLGIAINILSPLFTLLAPAFFPFSFGFFPFIILYLSNSWWLEPKEFTYVQIVDKLEMSVPFFAALGFLSGYIYEMTIKKSKLIRWFLTLLPLVIEIALSASYGYIAR